jgi:hypothetical protein
MPFVALVPLFFARTAEVANLQCVKIVEVADMSLVFWAALDLSPRQHVAD